MTSRIRKLLGTAVFATTVLLQSMTSLSATTHYATAVVGGGSAAVLGAPDRNFIQLGQFASITLDFGSISTTSMLLQIFTYDDPYPAPASIEVSANNANFLTVSSSVSDAQGEYPPYPSANFLVADLFRYVRITDLGLSPAPYQNLGFDLDAVGRTVVPLPAAAWLFGSALLGLVVVARRKAAA